MSSLAISQLPPRQRPRESHRDATRRDELRLFRAYSATGDPAIKRQLAVRLLPLARSLAARYEARTESREDLVQVASLGLMKAIEAFDPGYGKPFAAFATPTILGELRRHFRDNVWNLRAPRSLQERILKLTAAVPVLAQRLGRTPTVNDLADKLGLSAEEVLEAMEADNKRETRSTDAPASSGGHEPGRPLLETTGHVDPGFATVEAQASCRESSLTERELRVLKMRFDEDLTQSEIGERLGISQMQVSRISRRGLWKLLNGVRGEPAPIAGPPPTKSRRTAAAGTQD